MAWRNEPMIRDLEPYAKKHGLDYVVLFGVKGKENRYNVTTYGQNRILCNAAKVAGDQLHRLVQAGTWPDWNGVLDPDGEPMQDVLRAAKRAVAVCQDGMQQLRKDGVHSGGFASQADQFAAAWRDLKEALAAAEAAEGGE